MTSWTKAEEGLLRQTVSSLRPEGKTNLEIADTLVRNGQMPNHTKLGICVRIGILGMRQRRGGRRTKTQENGVVVLGERKLERIMLLLEERKRLAKKVQRLDEALVKLGLNG